MEIVEARRAPPSAPPSGNPRGRVYKEKAPGPDYYKMFEQARRSERALVVKGNRYTLPMELEHIDEL